MRSKHSSPKKLAEQVVKDIRRATRRHFSSEDKIRIVLEGLRGEDSIAELCRKEGIAQSQYYTWSKEFLDELPEFPRQVLDSLRQPIETGEAVVALDHPPKSGLARATPVQIVLRLDELVMLSTSLVCSINESMPRNDSWRFLEIGRRLERAIHLVTVLRNLSGVPTNEDSDIRRVSERRQLHAIVALIGTRVLPGMQGGGRTDRRRTLEAVLTNAENPRSLVFQLSRLTWLLANLPAPSADGQAAEVLVARAREHVSNATKLVYEAIDAACPTGKRLGRSGDMPDEQDVLRNAFAPIDALLPEVSNLLASAYFTHAFARRA